MFEPDYKLTEEDLQPAIEILVKAGLQWHYRHHTDRGYPTASNCADSAIKDATKLLQKLATERLAAAIAADPSIPGADWSIDDYPFLYSKDPNFNQYHRLPMSELRTALQDMVDRVARNGSDLLSLTKPMHAERARLFLSGLGYSEVARQVGVGSSSVQGSLEVAYETCRRAGRTNP